MVATKTESGETNLDISHESLIRNWARLNEWLDTEKEAAAQYESKAKQATKKASDERDRANEEKKNARKQSEIAKANEHLANVRLYASQLADAKREFENDNYSVARLRLDQTKPGLRGWEYRYLDCIVSPPIARSTDTRVRCRVCRSARTACGSSVAAMTRH